MALSNIVAGKSDRRFCLNRCECSFLDRICIKSFFKPNSIQLPTPVFQQKAFGGIDKPMILDKRLLRWRRRNVESPPRCHRTGEPRAFCPGTPAETTEGDVYEATGHTARGPAGRVRMGFMGMGQSTTQLSPCQNQLAGLYLFAARTLSLTGL
jgi:hypothetical protein